MPWGLKRYYGTGALHFITWSCYRRRPLLGNPARRDLVRRQMDIQLDPRNILNRGRFVAGI